MRSLSPKALISLSSCTPSQYPRPYAILISHFSTFSIHHNPPYYPTRRHEESRNVRVSVWWDFENCHLPVGANVFKVSQAVTAAVRANGIRGPVQITAFGDMMQLSRANQEALSCTGISLTHIPNGGKNSADRSLLVDLMYWVSQNPPPAHLFLISGDRDFASILHRLRMNNYNILLASTDTAPGVLCSAASIVWHWNALVRGENLTGNYFNQPPDGPDGSWYGQYKVPPEDPFSIVELPACSQAGDLSKPCSGLRPIPKTIVKQIQHLLSLYPKGISITEFRSELRKTNVSLDKDLYGYKSISSRATEPFNTGNQDPTASLKCNGERRATGSMNEKSSMPPVATVQDVKTPSGKVPQSPPTAENTVEVVAKQTGKKVTEPQPAEKTVKEAVNSTKEVRKPLPVDEKVPEVINTQENEGHSPHREEQNSASEVGFLKRIWKIFFGSNAGGSGMKSGNISDEIIISEGCSGKINKSTRNCFTNVDTFEKIENGRKSAELKSQKVDRSPAMHSLSGIESTMDNMITKSSEIHGEKSSTSSGFFSRIVSWCKFRSSSDLDTSGDQHSANLNQSNDFSGKHETFALNSFWVDIESFIGTMRGSMLIVGSRDREQMAQNLQKEGPSVLKSLTESDLLQLVDMLISKRKCVEERTSQEFPFTLAECFQKKSSSGDSRALNESLLDSHASNELSSLFLGRSSPPVRKKVPVEDQEKKIHSIPHAGPASPPTGKRSSDRYTSDMKADCQKLLNEILKNHPDGYNMGSFRKLFHDRYGYYIDLQRLGYQKLAHLLQTMPGVKIESSCIFPSGKTSKSSSLEAGLPTIQENNTRVGLTNSNSDLSDSDSPWDELGPVDDVNSGRKGPQGVSVKNAIEPYADDKSTFSDDVFSDSDEETLAMTPIAEGKPTKNEQDSPLLQVLGSWYSREEGEKRKDEFGNVNGTVDGTKNGLKSFSSSGINTKSENSSLDNRKILKPQKTYSFVQDSVEEGKDKLIENILGSLKKPGDSRMQG